MYWWWMASRTASFCAAEAGPAANDRHDRIVAAREVRQRPTLGQLEDGDVLQPQAGVTHLRPQLDELEFALRRDLLGVPRRTDEAGIHVEHPAAAVVLPDGRQTLVAADQVAALPVQPGRVVQRRQLPGLVLVNVRLGGGRLDAGRDRFGGDRFGRDRGRGNLEWGAAGRTFRGPAGQMVLRGNTAAAAGALARDHGLTSQDFRGGLSPRVKICSLTVRNPR